MSRRDSRVSMNVRQNDALFEFETFKKKFLLANKHITKLNSTLSVRIEELNAQIATLYVENLRLRASEITLNAQLKKEREKSKKVMADAEAATLNLTKHLGFLRHTLKISSSSPPPPSPPPPRARRPVLDPASSPQVPRLSRPPSFPGIFEEEEGVAYSMDEDQEPEQGKQPSPVRRKSKSKPRLSASRLPLPSRVSPPPPLPALETSGPFHIDFQGPADASTSRKKPSRRQSGLLNPNSSKAGGRGELHVPRPASPAFGSPIRRDAALEEEEEEIAVATALTIKGEMYADADGEMEALVRRDKRKGKERESESGGDSGRTRERERKRPREEEDSSSTTEGSKLKLKDVTNSPRSRTALPPLDTNMGAVDRERHQTPDTDIPTSAMTATSTSTARTFLSTPATTPGPEPYLPTPRASSSPLPPACASEAEGSAGGRERRARKSVNYAEPKLNTKMRKPDPTSGMPTIGARKQSATFNSIPTYSEADGGDEAGTRSSLEREGTPVNRYVDGSLPALPSLPVTPRAPAGVTTVKRKKSRVLLIPDDDDSDGAQADVDIEVGGTIGWVNVEGRRKSSVQNVSRKLIRAVEERRRMEEDDGRRYSMAV